MRIFYSWQSDLPNNTNRGFIQSALEIAIKELVNDDEVGVEPVLDRDTANVAGAPDITSTIFDKIARSDSIVCDITIINQGATQRLTPNPNVLIELGYGAARLG